MLQTKLINGTDSALRIQEGSAGVKRTIGIIGKEKSYTVNVDGNATYREYWISSLESGDPIVISSDDCQAYSEITIYFDKELYYEGILRNKTDGNVGNTGKGGTSWFSRLLGKVTSYCHLHFDANLFSE